MDPEEAELLNDYRYRSYAAVIEKALRNFESSSEWADLISSLGKLNKALQSNLKYSLLPRRLIIGKRLAQCLHPALPSGVHLKALETYEIIFKIIGTKWLARDLFIYSSGLFPLLSHAAMAVKPVLLGLYERYFLPLQRALLPSLQAFVMGLLPGLEEGLEVYDRADALLCRLGHLVGQRVLYGALWGSLLVCPLVRLPATLFIVAHFDRMAAPRLQRDMLGTDHRLVVRSICLSLQDSNVLVQRNMLEILLYFLPFATCLDPVEGAIPLSREDMITVVSAAALTLLRRDMSLNRRLYAWILGTDIKGGMVAPDPSQSTTLEEHTAFYFNRHSRELLVEALVSILKQKDSKSDPENVLEYLKPFRVIISLLDKPEIGPVLVSDVLLEVLRAFHCYCRESLGEDTTSSSSSSTSSSTSSSHIASKMKENKVTSEIIKTVNMLFNAMSSDYLWDYLTKRFHTSLSSSTSVAESKSWSSPPSVTELSTLIIFLLDVIPLELDSDIQSHFLPQMLSSMLRSLRGHMTSLSQWELTQALRVCFKVLGRVQIPMAYMDMEAEAMTRLEEDSPTQRVKRDHEREENHAAHSHTNGHHSNGHHSNGHHSNGAVEPVVVVNGDGGPEAEPGEAVFPPLRSEDSGLGLSASPSEQHLLPGRDWSDAAMGVCPQREDVWRRGGSVESITHNVQEILAAVINSYLLCAVEEDQGKAAAAQPDRSAPSLGKKGSSPGRRSSREHMSMPQIKDRLAEIFTPNKLKRRSSSTDSSPGGRDWLSGHAPRSRSEVTEAGRQAFTAACHLMLESTTFPLYLSTEENAHLYEQMFNSTGTEKGTLPEWLRSLMALCCLSKDYQVQHVAVSSLLELVNHSQTLALVVKDKTRRARQARPGASLQNGHLQMVTVPPIHPAMLTAVEQTTDFYQRVAQVLWCALDSERREHHLSCVELFYRLHCLAPSPHVCEDIICLGLLHTDKTVRLESLHRFSVLWHLTREMQFSMSLSLHRSFDRSLFVVLDSLNTEDSSIIAAGESWLLRALSLGDALRILEPVLLLLLDPRTQRMSIQNVKQNFTIGNLRVLTHRERHSSGVHGDGKGQSEQSALLSSLISLDRQAMWEELNRDPEQEQASDWPAALSRSGSEETSEEDNNNDEVREDDEESDHTESADTSGAQVSTETNSSSTSGSAPYIHRHDDQGSGSGEPEGVRRVDSARTQASDSLSSEGEEEEEEEEGEAEELEALARLRQLRRQQERRQAADSLFQHALLYAGPHDHQRLLRPLGMLGALLGPAGGARGAALVEALSTTPLDFAGHLGLLQELLLRHRQSQDGGSFYGPILTARSPPSSTSASPSIPPSSSSSSPPPPSSSPSPAPSVLLELLVSLCLALMRSHYPSYAGVGPRHLHGNRAVQVRSAEVLARLAAELVSVATRGAGAGPGAERARGAACVWRLLADCKVQEYVLLSLCASMHTCQRAHTHAHTHSHAHTHTHGGGGGGAGDAVLLDPEEGGEVSEEGLVDFGRLSEASAHERPLQVALLRLLRVLIVLEHHVWPSNAARGLPGGGVAGDNHPHQNHKHQPAGSSASQNASGSSLAREWQTAVLYQQSIRALQYVQAHPVTAQGMFVSAAGRALQGQYGHSLHPAWLELLGSVLPFLGRSLGLIAAPLLSQMCRNLDELVKAHEHDGVKGTQSSSLKKENIAPDYPLTLLEGITDITHYCLLENKKSSQGGDAADMRNARNAVLEEFPHMLSSMALLWGVVKGEESQRRGADSIQLSRHSATSVYFKSTKVLRQKVLDFLTPLTQQFGVQLMASVAAVWSSRRSRRRHAKNKILPEASESRLTIVHLVKSLSSLRTDTILQLVKEVVKKPHQIKGDQKSTLADIPMLQFSYAFIQSLPAQSLHDNVLPLLSLLRESAQLNLAPPGHFLLLGILNDFVNRLPNIDNKRDTRELQEVTQRILEAVGGVAGSSLEQTSWLSRNLEVKAQPQVCLQEDQDDPEDNDLDDSAGQASAMVSSSAPSVYSVQALALLAEILAPLLDMVYRSDEKEKAVPLISRLMYYVYPYLKNHSAYNMPSFGAGAQLLSSLSGYAYTKRAWKKEVLELYMDPLFFHMDPSCTCHWRAIIDHLLTHEKTMFKDLMSMQSSSLKLFPSAEQKPMLLKRQAFAMFSGELDQYHLYLPLIQERLTENLRMGQTASIAAQMFLMFRVLLLRISPQHLTSLWPIMVTELIRSFVRLEKALMEDKEASKTKARGAPEKNGVVAFSASDLDMYLSACKFLDMAISFPPERMPLFQMYRWAFVPEVDVDSYSGPENNLLEGEQECTPHVSRVLEGLQRRYGELNGVVGESSTERLEFPLLTLRSLSSITQLQPFLHTLSCSFRGRPGNSDPGDPWPAADYPAHSSEDVLRRLEAITEGEFLSSMEG